MALACIQARRLPSARPPLGMLLQSHTRHVQQEELGQGRAHIHMPQVFEDVDLCHEAQLLLVGLPRDEFDGHRCRAVQDAFVHLNSSCASACCRRVLPP